MQSEWILQDRYQCTLVAILIRIKKMAMWLSGLCASSQLSLKRNVLQRLKVDMIILRFFEVRSL